MKRISTRYRILSVLPLLLSGLLLWPSALRAQRSIQVISPNGGEKITAGTSIDIVWEATGFDPKDDVEVEYSVDGGNQWRGIDKAGASAERITWTVRNRPSETALVRVMSRDGSVGDESDGYFTIEEDPLDMTVLFAPNGGEEWSAGTTQTISWQAPADAVEVTLDLSIDFGFTWQKIGTYPAAMGSTTYLVPHLSDESITSAAVRVSVTEAPDHFDMSDGPFTITPEETGGGGEKPSLRLLYPNGGEVFAEDSIVIIRWESADIPDRIEVEFSADGGLNWKKIDRVDATTSEIDWRVPGEETAEGVIRVRREDGSREDISDSYFTVNANPLEPILLISPRGGESRHQGDTLQIDWSAPADMVTALLEYSLDGGTDWMPIKVLPAADATYNWNVPVFADTVIPDLLLRIVDVEHAGRVTVSGPITLLPKEKISGIAGESDRPIELAPNPAGSETTIMLGDRAALIRIISPDGRLMKELQARGNYRISLEGLGTGLYFVSVVSEGRRREHRLVVIH